MCGERDGERDSPYMRSLRRRGDVKLHQTTQREKEREREGEGQRDREAGRER